MRSKGMGKTQVSRIFKISRNTIDLYLKEKEFKRLCDVKPKLFDEMVDILKQELPKQKQRGGEPKLTIEDQLLIAPLILARISYLFSYFRRYEGFINSRFVE